ncbi:N-acetyl sugar amidotransferase [Geomonas azotofigens]|uniref:N-acetyl sugar amidotransferase n=1 Tax=Geomonas azotofigens TaxID=2843196 RepID=UPI002E2807EC|nr:N-acetyl sugar amidotransferase [Geomonas azotofigens]
MSCTRCIYDSKVPYITFDESGMCNYCKMMDDLQAQYATGTPEGERQLMQIIEQIKKDGHGKKYDCVVGVSGGTDSSYMLYKAVQWGLRPLAVHYDNTWNSAIATENIKKMLKKLNVELYTYVVDNKEIDDIFRAFFLSGVPELDASTDLAIAEVLYRAASKFGVKYILEGHSFKTEGIAPLGSFYFDGKYIDSIHKRFGKVKRRTYPLMDFTAFMKWTLLKRIKKIRPFWYIDYTKESAREFLEREFDWQYYGGHHLENRLIAFNHSYYLPNKFQIDLRNLSLAASARSGLMAREEALRLYAEPPHLEDDLLEYFKKRLGLSDQEFEAQMSGARRNFRDYPTYKSLFEKLRPLFFVMAKMNLVPMSFYIKYTSKNGV